MPDYDFRSLSPREFELLARDLLQKELHVRLESFKQGKDQGIDFRHILPNGRAWIIQVKHFAESGFPALKRDIKKEITKADRLKPSRYILVTSLGLNPRMKRELLTMLKPHCSSEMDIFGKDDLNNLLGRFPDVDKAHFKLWLTSTSVLDQLLHADTYFQSQMMVRSMQQRMRTYVPTKSFREARRILEKHHCCIISGIPGIGKTTLAEALVVSYARDGFQPLLISRDIQEVFSVAKTGKPQIFLYDDFLGQSVERVILTKNEDDRLLRFLEEIRHSKSHRLLLTTREYILQAAFQSQEKLALQHDQLDARKYILALPDYSRHDKALILYNHIYFSKLPVRYRRNLLSKRSYLRIIDHSNYSPRLISLSIERAPIPSSLPSGTSFTDWFLSHLDNPVLLWKAPFENVLTHLSRSLLIVMTSFPSRVSDSDLRKALIMFTSSQPEPSEFDIKYHASLKELDDTFISSNNFDDRLFYEYHNPSVRDFMINYLVSHTSVMEKLLSHTAFFEQCRVLWEIRVSKSSPQPGLFKPIVDAWTTALERTLESSEIADIHLPSDPPKVRPRIGDTFSRLELGFLIAAGLELHIDHPFLALLLRKCRSIVVSKTPAAAELALSPFFTDLTAFVQYLSRSPYASVIGDDEWSELFMSFIREPSAISIPAFRFLVQYGELYPNALGNTERYTIRVRFLICLDKVGKEIRQLQWEDPHDGLMFLQNLSTALITIARSAGENIDPLQSEIRTISAALQHEQSILEGPSHDNGEDRDWSPDEPDYHDDGDYSVGPREASDDEIATMFEDLR